MAMAAGAALLLSVATKMARSPPRLPYPLECHGRVPTSSGGLRRFSTSTGGSMPEPPPNLRGPQTYDKKAPSRSVWQCFLDGVLDAAPMTAYCLVIGGFTYTYFYVIPRLDRIDAKLVAIIEETKQHLNETKQRLNETGHAEGKFSKGQSIQLPGRGKEHL